MGKKRKRVEGKGIAGKERVRESERSSQNNIIIIIITTLITEIFSQGDAGVNGGFTSSHRHVGGIGDQTSTLHDTHLGEGCHWLKCY